MDKLKINTIPLKEPVAGNAITSDSKTKKSDFKNILNKKISLKSAKTEPKEEEKIWRAAQDFEAFFLAQLFSEMRKTIPKTDFFGSRKKEELFQGLLDEAVCKNLAKGKGLGLAEMLYKQIKPQNIKNTDANTDGLTDFIKKGNNRG